MTVGIILLNLGGPDSLQAVRPFLYNLFSDRQIIRLGPSFMQKPLAWLISTIRSKKTEQYYKLIGGKSPILDITKAQAKALEESLNSELRTLASASRLGRQNSERSFKVFIGMRYWSPFIEDIIPEIYSKGIRKVIALSLYPQYSVTTSGSSISKLKEVLSNYQMETVYISSWHTHPLYIESLVDVIKKGIESFAVNAKRKTQNAEPEVHLLFSAHSLPQKIIDEGDPYADQTLETIEEVMKKIPLKWHLSYQSKSGPVQWLEPSTEDKIKELAGEGVKNLLVVPISFISDHIETLYEIDILYKKLAESLGINLKRTDSLNTHPTFIKALEDIVISELKKTGSKS